MTRKDLEDIIRDCIDYGSEEGDEITIDCELAADRILAALDKEKAGEVVLAEGDNTIGEWLDMSLVPMRGKKGQLIFRPYTGKGEGI